MYFLGIFYSRGNDSKRTNHGEDNRGCHDVAYIDSDTIANADNKANEKNTYEMLRIEETLHTEHAEIHDYENSKVVVNVC